MPLTPDDQVSAAELALELLEGEERATLLRRVLEDRTFAAAVEEWRTTFAALFAAGPGVEPPRSLIRKLDAISADVRPWRWGVGIATLAVAALTLALVVRPSVPPSNHAIPTAMPVAYAAAMAPTSGEQGKPFAALFDPVAGQVRLALAIDVPSGRTAQLWRIGANGVPHSLGLLTGTRTAVRLTPEDRAALVAGATLAVSIEPLGGSPTTQPSGPVVSTGKLTRI